MSAKLLYSLSDEKPDLQKQIGCMNGFLHFFERRHLISDRGINSRNRRLLPPGENSHQGKEANGSSKRSKEKQQKVVKEIHGNPTEPSRISVSSSTGSTLSTSEHDWTTKPEQPPFDKHIITDNHSEDSSTNRTFSSPSTSRRFHMKNVVVDSISTCASPIRTPKREQLVRQAAKHMDSPRLLQPSKLDSSRLAALNESFRSVGSNQCVPITPLRRKDAPRMSCDGTETRETFVSGLKVGDLPRLSLDSRQRTINKANRLQNLPEEPGSYRTPSSIVAKLMGLEAVSDCNSTNQSQNCGKLDSFSRSSRTIDESKVNRVLDSPRNRYKDSRTPQLNNTELVREPEPSASTPLEPGPQNHSITVYGEIEKRLADIDFKKSGKDLRALKQILKAIHRDKKAMMERSENQSSGSASQTSSGNSAYTSQTQCPKKEKRQLRRATSTIPHRSEGARLPQDIKSPRSVKQDKLVRGSRNEAGHLSVRNLPSQRFHGLGTGQPVNTIRNSVESKTAKNPNPKTDRGQCTAATSLRPLKTSKIPRPVNEVNVTSSAKISESLSSKTMVSRTKHNQLTMMPSSQNRKLSPNSTKLSTESTCLNQHGNADSWLPEKNSCFSQIDTGITNTDRSPLAYDTQQQVSDHKHPEGIPSDGLYTELAISIQEQPSPVSVLDSAFYEDESPSPIKKKPTAFQGFHADDESIEATTETEWKDADLSYSTYSVKESFNYDTTYKEEENFKQSAQTISEPNSNKGESISRPLHKEANLDKAYVAEILLASGFLNNLNFNNINHHAHQLKEAINPNLFFILEQTTGSRFLSDGNPFRNANTTTNDRHKRKLMFEAVNEIVSEKLAFTSIGPQPQPFLKRSSAFITGQQLLQEICREINQLQSNSSYQSLDDEDDFLTGIIEKDLTHRSANWTDISSEIPSLVLDIERIIFKDLIVELVHNESSQAQAQSQLHINDPSK